MQRCDRMSTIERLRELGQSAWLDFLDHELLMIERKGLSGLTSNPTILEKAISGTSAYDGFIRHAPPAEAPRSVLGRMIVMDVRDACDRFRSVYEETDGRDGFVSVEVPPEVARLTDRSIAEARRLWHAIDRPNLLVKIPGTLEGVAAIEQCLVDGISVNVTLLFSVARFRDVAHAYLRALERRVEKGDGISRVASVASFFVSRVDSKIDRALALMPNTLAGAAGALRGQIAIANAKIAYEEYEGLVAGERFRALAAHGARPQRLLWASTSTKDPAYPDVYYVEALVGRDTVSTMPLETFRAYVDHGQPEERLGRDRALAHEQMTALAKLGIDFDVVARALEDEGVEAFAASFEKSIRDIDEKRRRLRAS
jgi:transaldolase